MPTNVSVERRQLLEVWGAEIIESPGPRGRTAPSAWPSAWPRSTPSGSSSTSTATRPTPGRTTRGPGPRSCATAPRSPTSWPASARRARCSASVASCREARRRADLGRRAAGGRDGRRAAQPRRRLHPAHLRGAGRRGAARPQDHGAAPRVDRMDPAADRGRGLRRHLDRARPLAGAVKCAASMRAASRGRSWWSRPTAVGSTCRRERGPTTSTRSPSEPRGSSTSEGLRLLRAFNTGFVNGLLWPSPT